MTAKTPVYQLEYLVPGEPAKTTRQVLERNAKSIEAALLARGVPAPGASDLAEVAGRVATLETPMSGRYTLTQTGVANGALTNLATLTKARESGGLVAGVTNGVLTLPPGLWSLWWGYRMYGGGLAASGRNFLTAMIGATVAARAPFMTPGEDIGSASMVLEAPGAAPTAFTLQHLNTATAGPWSVDHTIRATYLGKL